MYLHIYYLENKRMGEILSKDKKDENFLQKLFTRFENPLESLGGREGGDEKAWESPNLLVRHPDVCSL